MSSEGHRVSVMKVCVSLVRVREKLEVVLLVCVNCVIISLFSLPIIFYFIPQVSQVTDTNHALTAKFQCLNTWPSHVLCCTYV